MSRIILAHPYSGALYRYFSDQIAGQHSHSKATGYNSYYKTLYAKDYERASELALCFLLLHDEVWVAPADTHWPQSRETGDATKFIPELGLHSDWDDFYSGDHGERKQYIDELFEDTRLVATLGGALRLPRTSWRLVVEYALYEASLSARTRIPILCSPGRRRLIEVLVDIQRPALHPIMTPNNKVKFVETYRNLCGLALSPKSLDQLMDAKPDADLRRYALAFVSAAEDPNAPDNSPALAKAALEAMNTERVAQLFSGALNWAAKFLRMADRNLFAGAATAGSYLARRSAEAAGWYEFKGSIDRAVDKSGFIRQLEAELSKDVNNG